MENLPKIYKNFFYFRKNLEKIQPIAPRAGSGRLEPAQAGSAQLVFFEKSTAIRGCQKIDSWALTKVKKFLLLGWMLWKSLIADIFKFPSVLNFPQPNESSKCRSRKDTAGRAICGKLTGCENSCRD